RILAVVDPQVRVSELHAHVTELRVPLQREAELDDRRRVLTFVDELSRSLDVSGRIGLATTDGDREEAASGGDAYAMRHMRGSAVVCASGGPVEDVGSALSPR